MIPKIIHYCWFGRGLMPKSHRDCIKDWKRLMPDWQFVRWDERNFPIDYCAYTQEAYRQGRYAFVADVARLYALYTQGGIYLDTDVELLQPLDRFLDDRFFTAIERYYKFEEDHIAEQYLHEDGSPINPDQDVPNMEILTSTIGSEKGHPLLSTLIGFYSSIQTEAGSNLRQSVVFDRLVARSLVPCGFKYKDETQHLSDGIVIYGTGLFGYAHSPNPDYSVSYHYNTATWDQDGWSLGRRLALKSDELGVRHLYERVRKIKKRLCNR